MKCKFYFFLTFLFLLLKIFIFEVAKFYITKYASNKNLALHCRQNSCPGTTLIFCGFQLLCHLESNYWFIFNFATMFHQYSTTSIFPPLRSKAKHLFIIQHMVISFSFTFKSPALHKYAFASSLSELSEFLILQFLEKCCRLHSVLKIPSKSHMLDFVLISGVYFTC